MRATYPTRLTGALGAVPRQTPIAPAADGPLSAAQRRRYVERGFLILPDLIDQARCAAVAAELQRMRAAAEAGEAPGHIRTTFEHDQDALRTLWSPHRHPELGELHRDPGLLGAAEQLLGGAVYIHQSRINFQPPGVGQGFYWHQDFEAWHAEDGMPRPTVCSALIMLEPSRAWNGALMVVPGSHRSLLQTPGPTPPENWTRSLSDPRIGFGAIPTASLRAAIEEGGVEYCEGEVGTVVLFDGLLIHGSHGNISPFGRSTAFFVYNRTDNRLGAPFAAPGPRPEHLAARDPEASRPVTAR